MKKLKEIYSKGQAKHLKHSNKMKKHKIKFQMRKFYYYNKKLLTRVKNFAIIDL